ncbi:hypothetical protein, partial [Escherichia coli]|uniref:hypothetical protein n=1 Tax=Escherichia coli TaxID=562 RepID=UPI000B7D3C3E
PVYLFLREFSLQDSRDGSYRMNPHDRLRSLLAEAHQEWQAFAYDMQSHENHYIKRAGVSGIRGALAVLC